MSQKMWYYLTQESFFDYMYKVWFLPDFSIWICQLFSLRYVSYKNIFFLVQREGVCTLYILVWTS
jgi:hypothetical protein